ncbi:MAG: FtsQ-type POTRA domain-containing protein [Deltaproteobacteria bacterium]|nr:FtsQ-type POTRA domain-containing protein [Deltaproteobacteria bacterium]
MKDYSFQDNLIKPKEVKSTLRKKDYFFKTLSLLGFFFGLLFFIFVLSKIPGHLLSPVKDIRITGNETLSKELIVRQLDITADHTWIGLDPYELSRRLKTIPWIDSVMVKRNYALGLDIFIKEKKPVAFFKTGKGLFLLSTDNLVLSSRLDGREWNLPVIVDNRVRDLKVGDYLEETELNNAHRFISFLSSNPVLSIDSISEINITNPFNLQAITMPDGILIKFGYKDFDEKLRRLYYALPEIMKLKSKIDYIDLRNQSGVVIKQS